MIFFGFKTVTTLLNTHDGLKLGLNSIHSTISSLNCFVIVLYPDKPLVDLRVNFSIRGISDNIFPPLLTKLRAALRPMLVYFIKCFVVGSKTIELETPFSISS